MARCFALVQSHARIQHWSWRHQLQQQLAAMFNLTWFFLIFEYNTVHIYIYIYTCIYIFLYLMCVAFLEPSWAKWEPMLQKQTRPYLLNSWIWFHFCCVNEHLDEWNVHTSWTFDSLVGPVCWVKFCRSKQFDISKTNITFTVTSFDL